MTTTEIVEKSSAALAVMSTAELKDELGRTLEVTARHLTYLAAVWQELERRGENMSHLRSGLWAYMSAIAAGQLRAEIVVQYAGHAMLLRKLSALPIAEQDKLLSDNTVAFVEYDGKNFEERRTPITHLKAHQIAQVIGSDHIRSTDEQRRTAVAFARRAKPNVRGANIAERAREIQAPRGEKAVLTLQLTTAEHKNLSRRAKDAGTTMAALVRAALIETKLIEPVD